MVDFAENFETTQESKTMPDKCDEPIFVDFLTVTLFGVEKT